MVNDIDLYIQQLNTRINNLRIQRKTFLYDFDIEFSSSEKRAEASNKIKEYFSKFSMGVEIRMCQQCGNRKFDLIILWSL